MGLLARLRPFGRLRRLFLISAGLVISYAVLGFLVLPAVLKAQLPKRLSKALGRPVSLAQVRVNPFSLSVTLDGFRVQDRDGQPFLGWDRLYLNLDASSLVTRTLSFKAIHLTRPYGRVVLDRGGRLNFADLLDRPGSAQPDPGPARGLHIGALRILGARLDLLDQGPAKPFATTLGPVTLVLDDFRTGPGQRSPYQFAGRTEAGESFAWSGQFSPEPLRSQGQLRLDRLKLAKYHPYYQDQVAFDLRQGLASLSAGYSFEWSPGRHLLTIQNASFDLTGLSLAHPGRPEPALTLGALEVRGGQADLLERWAEIGSIRLRQGRLGLTRGRDGSLDLQRLLTPKPRPASPEPAAPFRLHLAELGLSDFQIEIQDQVPVRPVHLAVRDLELTLNDLSLDPKSSCRLALSASLQDRARLSLRGTVSPLEPALDLAVDLQGLALAPFDPYLEPGLNARISSGTLAVTGRARGRFGPGPDPGQAFTGQVRVDRLEVMDGSRSEPFLRYRSLALRGLDLRTQPERVALQEVELVEPEYRLVIAADGSSNVARALNQAPAAAATPLAGALAGAVPAREQPTLALNIQKIIMHQGRMSFIDRSLEPNAVLLLSALEATNTGLSSHTDGQSQLTLKGLAGGIGVLSVQGRAMPLAHDRDTDLSVRLTGANLTDFSPYAAKYLGYPIREGKLDLEARVRINNRQLQVEDRTKLDQFFLGDRVASPDATHLPVKLGLALLRDRRGVITLDLPVDGSLDDPNLHYGRMVWNAVLNALGKVVTSPFALLGKLVGSDADLSHASFSPGSSSLDPQQTSKLTALIKALQDRPELRLEVEATADPAADAAALRQASLEALLSRTRSLAGQPELALGSALPDRERWLRVAFDQAFPPVPGSKAPVAPVAELEQRLLASLPVSANELKALADARTRATVARLLEADQVEPSRVFVIQGGPAAQQGGCKVHFSLK